jgi:hypothetical protein
MILSEYVKSTNFASKDSLSIGNPLKIVKGTEIDTEFNNIATAVATKADIANPTFTGVPAAPTAASGTNTTQLATTAFVQATLLASVYPVGSIYINAGVTTNPATLLGFGTWTAFGAGRVMIGLNGSDALFDTLEETGGSKDATVVSHTHTGSTSTAGAHVHTMVFEHNQFDHGITGNVGDNGGLSPTRTAGSMSTEGAHTHSFTTDATGSSGTNANLQPYITVAMWKRTS